MRCVSWSHLCVAFRVAYPVACRAAHHVACDAPSICILVITFAGARIEKMGAAAAADPSTGGVCADMNESVGPYTISVIVTYIILTFKLL